MASGAATGATGVVGRSTAHVPRALRVVTAQRAVPSIEDSFQWLSLRDALCAPRECPKLEHLNGFRKAIHNAQVDQAWKRVLIGHRDG